MVLFSQFRTPRTASRQSKQPDKGFTAFTPSAPLLSCFKMHLLSRAKLPPSESTITLATFEMLPVRVATSMALPIRQDKETVFLIIDLFESRTVCGRRAFATWVLPNISYYLKRVCEEAPHLHACASKRSINYSVVFRGSHQL